jgi:predicted nucleic acid-binding protein
VIVADSSFILAVLDADDPHHALAAPLAEDDYVTTPLAVAELDHLALVRAGDRGQHALWAVLDSGALTVRWWADGLRETVQIARRFPFLGLTDASLVALLALQRSDRLATFDQHFRAITLPDGGGLTLIPDDA